MTWWQRHRWMLIGVFSGYLVLLALLRYVGALGTQWADTTTAYFVCANLVVLWWYADTTWRQLELNGKDYLERNKPVVFLDRVEDPDRNGHFHYAVRNVGGGYAVNVYYYDVTVVGPAAVGSLAAGEHRVMPRKIDEYLCGGGTVKSVVVAEAPYTRTTQWIATLNLRTQEGGDHQGQVLHHSAQVSAEPPRFKYQSLQAYMEANGESFRQQLKELDAESLAAPLLEKKERD